MARTALRSIAWLMRNGFDYDVACSLPEDERMAFSIVFGEFEGGKWSWGRMEWERPD